MRAHPVECFLNRLSRLVASVGSSVNILESSRVLNRACRASLMLSWQSEFEIAAFNPFRVKAF